ncbi:hypothetical protein [Streptomyces sp. NPDC093109]|uniref:hypothetical protein n=1 Tax=Streptomyces sp. NPDC093109 TaxID=3154977 RepID=UPI00344F8DB1
MDIPGYALGSGLDDGDGDDGDDGGGVSWLVTQWFAGPSTWKVFGALRKSAEGYGEAVAAAVALCRTVAGLHASGWVHSDLQPSHGIHTDSGVRLIDFAWSWRPGMEPTNDFRGAIVHLTAPELAASIDAGVRPVIPSMSAEVYALAGTLWTCATGRWPLDYDAVGFDRTTPLAVRRTAVAERRIPLDGARPWPALQGILRPVLLGARDDRPTAAELADALGAL